MTDNALGSEFGTNRIYYLLFLLGMFFIYSFLYIGMVNDPVYVGQTDKLVFYIWFGALLGLMPYVLDLIFKDNIELPLDTVGYEDNSPFPILNNVWVQIGSSFVLSALIWTRIQVSGQAFVKAPSFALTVPLISSLGLSDKLVGAFISGAVAGVVESIVFFGFILPTIYSILNKQGLNELVSAAIALIISALIFTGYHWWVYGYVLSALLAVLFFGLLQGLFVLTYRSMIPLFMTHFANNFAVSLFVVSAYLVQVLL